MTVFTLGKLLLALLEGGWAFCEKMFQNAHERNPAGQMLSSCLRPCGPMNTGESPCYAP